MCLVRIGTYNTHTQLNGLSHLATESIGKQWKKNTQTQDLCFHYYQNVQPKAKSTTGMGIQ